MKKLLGKNDIEDALKRLDTLTQEEARMAIAEVLKVTHVIDDFLRLINGEQIVTSLIHAILNYFVLVIIQQSMGRAEEENCSLFLVSPVRSQNLIIFVVKHLRLDLRRWLSPPDSSTNHNNSCTVHHEGTAKWFFQGGIYNEWRTTPSLLWMHGKRTFLPSASLYFTNSYLHSRLWKEHYVVCEISLISYTV